jgi:hypothetical protein
MLSTILAGQSKVMLQAPAPAPSSVEPQDLLQRENSLSRAYRIANVIFRATFY